MNKDGEWCGAVINVDGSDTLLDFISIVAIQTYIKTILDVTQNFR